MKCTSCKQGDLRPIRLDDLFPAFECEYCKGNLVFIHDYLRWMENNDQVGFTANTDDNCVEAEETSKAMICPKTGNLMLKYRISAKTTHRIDLSPSINAAWLDEGEWELLKSEGLAGKLNHIFTDAWQRKVREAGAAETFKAMYAREFGENYEAIQALREAIKDMPNKSEVVAYLICDDPYSA